ncbi:MAG: DUF3237 domain-containing protein [Clostridiaceae bacterium]|nr:DUF3237 domain-containing protein [Clostridiaceae bacterium]
MSFEDLFTVYIEIKEEISLKNFYGDSVVMIQFTGSATGKYFTGQVLPGAIDTQIIQKHGDRHIISARYMLEGKDYTGESCKIYIENNGYAIKEPSNVLFRTYPKIITDSKTLDFLNKDLLAGEVFFKDNELEAKFYRAV